MVSHAPGRNLALLCLWSLAWIAGLALGLALAMPIDAGACPAPGEGGRAGCMQQTWGRAVTIVLGSGSLGGLAGYAAIRPR